MFGLKTQAEIQRAHDILHFIASGECEPILSRDAAHAAAAAHDALSWVLGFPCGKTFQDNLGAIYNELIRLGYQEVDMGRPIVAGEQNG